MSTFATTSNQIAALKELYTGSDEYMQDLVYKENPFLALVPKNEAPGGFAGKYIPVPITTGNPQGRSHDFATAQNNQTASIVNSFFVFRVRDYQLVTITNELMEATKTDAGAFIDEAKYTMDNGFRNATNNIAFELFGDGSGVRGFIGSATAVGSVYTITLSNPQAIVSFEPGMTLVNSVPTLSGKTLVSLAALSATTGLITKVNRTLGIITVQASAVDASWSTAGNALGVQGDVQPGTINTGSSVALSGLQAWLPYTDPTTGDSFWGVDRSSDPTRLGGLRFDASAMTIEEGLTAALALGSREGAKFDLVIIDFASYSALVNSIGAKVQNVQVLHDEVQVAFDGIKLQSSYGPVEVLADRSCPAQTAYCLTMDSWKLRSLGKVPHILTYGMEGLEGLRVGNADALEIRIAYYGNLICSAPGRNMVVSLSA